MVLTIFLQRIDGLHLKYDRIIFLSGISSGFRIILDYSGLSSNLQISLVLTIFLYRILPIKYDMIIIFSGTSSGFRIYPNLSDFSGFSWFFRILSNLNFWVLIQSLLCSRSRTLVSKCIQPIILQFTQEKTMIVMRNFLWVFNRRHASKGCFKCQLKSNFAYPFELVLLSFSLFFSRNLHFSHFSLKEALCIELWVFHFFPWLFIHFSHFFADRFL